MFWVNFCDCGMIWICVFGCMYFLIDLFVFVLLVKFCFLLMLLILLLVKELSIIVDGCLLDGNWLGV